MKINQWSLRSRLTVGIVLLSAIGFLASFFGAASALRGYLVGQIDDQLSSVVGGTAMRLDRGAAIQNEEHELGEEHNSNKSKAPQPLQRIPTTLSVTLISQDGVIKGALGGDLAAAQITDYLTNFTNEKAVSTESKPFTIKADGPDFRAIAKVLPTTGDTLVVAQSLEAVDKTVHQLTALFLIIGLLDILISLNILPHCAFK